MKQFCTCKTTLTNSWKALTVLGSQINCLIVLFLHKGGGGRVVRSCWVNSRCRGVLLIWIIVGQVPIALAIGADGGCLDIFLLSIFPLFFLPLWQTARYRLKYCLKGPLNTKQPTKRSWRNLKVFKSSGVVRKCYLWSFDFVMKRIPF